MSLTRDGVWKGGVWAPTVWAQDVWYEPPAVSSPGGSGKRYRTHTDWDVQAERHRKKLKARVEKLQVRIEKQRKKLDLAKAELSEERIIKLALALQAMQQLLLKLLSELDEMNKAYEEAEAEEIMAVWLAYTRSLH